MLAATAAFAAPPATAPIELPPAVAQQMLDKAHAADAASTKASTEKFTYLGVTAKTVDDTLRAQLNLPDGVGLTVTTVDHKGPAGADIQTNDVLEKLDDQLLINAHQLVTLIRLHKPGDTVTVSLIREAKPIEVKIKLGEKERPIVPGNDTDRTGDPPDARITDTQMGMSFKDDVYTATVRTDKQGHKHMTVKNSAGTVVADGPVDTAEEWNKFSPDVREHLEVMHKMLLEQQK